MNYFKAQKLLKAHNQEQLLKYYDELNPDQQCALLSDISKIDFSVIGHIGNEGKSPIGPDELSPVPASSLNDIRLNLKKYDEEGLNLLRAGKVGAVLLAGGQGTRLGSDKPKGVFNIGVTKPLTIFGQLMQNISDVTARSKAFFHLFIMTSDLNNDYTVSFFKENNYFGYPEDKIHFFVQDSAPVCGLNGKILLAQKHKVAFSPNGNGGWYSSLVNSGLSKVIEREGIEWLNLFAVDNVLQRICDPAFIGATSLSGCNCGAKVVKKVCSTEKVGVICQRNGVPSVVEYYELPEEIASLKGDDGELKYPYGVILNYLFKVEALNDTVLEKLPYHVVKKAVPHIENGVLTLSGEPDSYKFETLVIDMIELMGSCLAYEVERAREFAPIKNSTGVDSVESARALLIKNGIQI